MPSLQKRRKGEAAAQPRLRVLAGPNGSGKSTIKSELRPEWIGTFVNADDIERELRLSSGQVDLAALGVKGAPAEVLSRFEASIARSTFARDLGLQASLVGQMSLGRGLVLQVPGPFNSYLASVLADAIRRELMEAGSTFTFETVMSSADKVEFMREAKQRGYRVYLYFVATDDPAINVDRVRRRVQQGGHPVPEKKVRERYARSINLLTDACNVAHRTYVFDNSGRKHKLLAEVTDGQELEVKTTTLPRWFTDTELWKSFQ